MNKIVIIYCLLLIPASLFSQQGRFSYLEGQVQVKLSSGEMVEAKLDQVLNMGESVITGYDGFAELNLEKNSTITIDRDTVFLFTQKEKKDEQKSIFMIVLGKVKFKFNRIFNEPDIQTPASVAGIRGTEFTVLSSFDGTSLFVVEDGAVEVESLGVALLLNREEAVEIALGETPGEKYEVKIGSVDFSSWIENGDLEFKNNPLETIEKIHKNFDGFSLESVRFYSIWEKSYSELSSLRKKMMDIGEKEGNEAKSLFYSENIFAKEISTSNLVLNYRYYALSALSLRRHVLSSMFVRMKTKYILDPQNKIYLDFLIEYDSFIEDYEKNVVPYLVEADI